MRTKTTAVGAALVFALVATPCGAQLLRTVDAGGGLYLNQVGERAWVRESDGAVGELDLPPGARLQRLAPLDGGWIAAGEIHAPGVTDLLLLRGDAGALRPFPAPPDPAEEPLRGWPTPLVENGRLVGLAWLAGPEIRQMAVWAARWSGLDWGQPELVSPAGPGTQIGVAGAVLADGSWLLIWSAHDGSDDEILWSRRVGETWSEPAPLHEPNDVPDALPSLAATGRGALAAWNWLDGKTYRVRLASFEEGAWRELEPESRPEGVRPSLTPHADGALLLYRTVVPSTWTVRELDERGGVLSAAVVESESPLRPGLAPAGEAPAALEWPGRSPATPLRIEAAWRAEP